MSRNQSRAEKTEGHLKRPGRSGNFGQNRGFSGGVKGGGPSAPGPAIPSSAAAPLPSPVSHEFSTNRSYKKSVNGQGEQSRANLGTAGSDEGNRAAPNGAHAVTNSHGPSDGLESGSSKPADSFNSKKAPRAVPKAPIPTEPTKSEVSTTGDDSGPLLQFGTINPGIMNGMQIPARTCSAPPNLDEQKRHQAVHDPVRTARAAPIPSAPKPQQAPQQPKQQHRVKDVGGANQMGNRESHPPTNPNRDMHPPITSTPNATPVRSSVLTMGGMPMHVPVPVPFQQTQIAQQFRGPDLQMPTQGIVPSSMQMSMALPAGNIAQVPQPMFVTSIPSHPMQPPPIMHQGQNMSFAPPLGHQMPTLGSMGVGHAPQFHQQQPTNYVSQRKAVKITHPETHEELKLDKRTDSHTDVGASVQRQLPTAASQAQSHPFSHQMSYFSTGYNTSPMFYSSQLSLSNAQRSGGPQTARYSTPVGQNGQTISYLNASTLNPASGGRVGPPNTFHGLSEAVNSDVLSASASLAAPSHVTIKPPILSSSEKVGTPSVRISMPITKPESLKKSKLPVDVTVAPQVRDNEVGLHNTATVQKKSFEPTVPDSSSSSTDKDLIRVSLMHVDKPESSSVVPTPVGSLTSVVKETNEGKNEAFIKSESPKDHQKRISKSELKHSQQQSGSLEYTAETLRSNGMASTAEDSSFIDSAGIHSAPSSDSYTSATGLIPTIGESRTSELEQKKDTVGSLDSRAALDEEPLEAVSLSCSGDRVSIDGESHLEASSSRSTAVDISVDNAKGLELGKIQENSTESECGLESYGNSSGCTSTESNLTATSIGSSDETAVIIMEVEKKAGSQLCDKDNVSYYEITGTGVPDVPTTTSSDRKDIELASSAQVPSIDDDEKISATDSTILKCEITSSKNAAAVEPTISSSEMPRILSDSEIKHKPEVDAVDHTSGETPSVPPVSCGKPSLEPSRPNRTNKKRNKNKNFSKADAATSSDLYDAYKVPDEKLDTISTLETAEISLAVDSNKNAAENHDNVHAAVELDEQSKPEFEDWESAADVSSPTLRSDNGKLIPVEKGMHSEYRNESTGKLTYSREFLLSFHDLCRDLPEGFDGSDATDILIRVLSGMSHDFDRDALPSPGRVIDRSSGSSRDRRMASDDDRWKAMNARPVQGVNHGVLRNPRLQTSNQLYGGILSGPTQSLASQGGITRNHSDADRWQRAPGTQRGLMPPPPMQTIHRSANRYEIGRVSDEEEQKQRRLKAILNKLTPQNFQKLFIQVKEVNIDNTVTLTGVISQIFDKALMEPTFCEMYADFCHHLAIDLPDFTEDNQKITFRRLLLNKCQEEFERGEREEAEADHAEEVGGTCQSEAEREMSRIQTRRRMLGNIRLIGELYKKKMLTARIMHECIRKLLGQFQNPDEENIEALCKLMSTIGEMIDDQQSKESMDAYFIMMEKLSKISSLSSRVRFMLKDTIDLRRNRWQQRRKVEGPKKIEDVHRDAAQERQAQTSRSARAPVISSKRGPPVDYGHRGSTTLNAPSPPLGGSSRALPSQARGSNSQDFRLDDRNPLEGKVLSVPLPHRPAVGMPITLGPQGGLAKGMSSRGAGVVSNVPSTEIGSRSDSQRLTSGSNGVSLTHDRIISTSRDDSMPKHVPNRSSGVTNDQTSFQDRNSAFGIRETHPVDHAFDGSDVAASGKRPGSSGGKMSISEPQQLSDDALRGKSISTIREFYSAKDENEVVLCIRELNTPSFCSSMVSIWVSDSFERKSTERSLLAQLLVNLTKGHNSLISRPQLIEGFESVLISLEDAVNDAPKAAEFLGHIFGKVIAENLVPLEVIGELIRKGGEMPGSLIEAGLGSEILGSVLEFVKMEKGDSVLNDIRTSSNLRFEEFKPPRASSKSKKLDAFL